MEASIPRSGAGAGAKTSFSFEGWETSNRSRSRTAPERRAARPPAPPPDGMNADAVRTSRATAWTHEICTQRARRGVAASAG